MSALPSLVGLAHLFDASRGDLAVVHATGPRADGLLGTRTPPGDALIARAMHAGKPAQVTFGSEPGADPNMCERHAFFDPWSVVLVPVVVDGRLLALFELIDPIQGKQVDDLAKDALAYVAGCLGRFLAEKA
jgi:hypothetical protein